MVFVEMAGRCGNQLFHYACARYIQIKTNDQKLICNFNRVFAQNNIQGGWYDCLADFNTVPYEYYKKEGTCLRNESSIFQKILIFIKVIHIKITAKKSREDRARTASKFQKILNKVNVYWIREGVTKVWPGSRPKKSIFTGVCESYEIFDEIQQELRNELTPKHPVMKENIELLEKILSTESVCISVRRGDFFNSENAKSFAVCTAKYYKDAVKIMESKKKEQLVYYIFSDDIEWCKSNLKVDNGNNVVYVSQNMPIYETLRLMYSCKHFIISNSTFSWWGQYLSSNEDKIVISPSRWNNDGFESRIIKPEWILIEV